MLDALYETELVGDERLCQEDMAALAHAAEKVAITWLIKAADQIQGYYTDTEYVTGKTIEEFLKENGY